MNQILLDNAIWQYLGGTELETHSAHIGINGWTLDYFFIEN